MVSEEHTLKHTRKILAGTLIVLILLTFAACSRTGETAGDNAASPPQIIETPAAGDPLTSLQSQTEGPGSDAASASSPQQPGSSGSGAAPTSPPQQPENPGPDNEDARNLGDSAGEKSGDISGVPDSPDGPDINDFTIKSYFNTYKNLPRTNVAFVIEGRHGTYHFSDKEMPLVKACEYVEAFESGLKFAKDFLRINRPNPLDLYFYQDDMLARYGAEITNGGGVAAGYIGYVDYDYSVTLSPFDAAHVMMHEASHALCGLTRFIHGFPMAQESSPPQILTNPEEGLATMLEHMFGYENRRLHDVYIYHYTEGGFNSPEGALDMVYDVAAALNHLAYRRSFQSDDFQNYLADGNRYAVLHSYYSAASFLNFLFEQSATEDFLRAYADSDLMEEIYGKGLDGMIEDWMAYMEDFILIYSE